MGGKNEFPSADFRLFLLMLQLPFFAHLYHFDTAFATKERFFILFFIFFMKSTLPGGVTLKRFWPNTFHAPYFSTIVFI